MVDADGPKFATLLHGLASAFRAELSDEQLESYWLALRDEMTIEAFELCCRAAVKRSKFFPTVAQLLEAKPAPPALPAWEDDEGARPVWTEEQKREADELRGRMLRNVTAERERKRQADARAADAMKAFMRRRAGRDDDLPGGLSTDEYDP